MAGLPPAKPLPKTQLYACLPNNTIQHYTKRLRRVFGKWVAGQTVCCVCAHRFFQTWYELDATESTSRHVRFNSVQVIATLGYIKL
jgi:hypothetical protein